MEDPFYDFYTNNYNDLNNDSYNGHRDDHRYINVTNNYNNDVLGGNIHNGYYDSKLVGYNNSNDNQMNTNNNYFYEIYFLESLT